LKSWKVDDPNRSYMLTVGFLESASNKPNSCRALCPSVWWLGRPTSHPVTPDRGKRGAFPWHPSISNPQPESNPQPIVQSSFFVVSIVVPIVVLPGGGSFVSPRGFYCSPRERVRGSPPRDGPAPRPGAPGGPRPHPVRGFTPRSVGSSVFFPSLIFRCLTPPPCHVMCVSSLLAHPMIECDSIRPGKISLSILTSLFSPLQPCL